jgi:prepilin signal peptidase PulO-like enzyme (type II secretory pathway)
MVPHVLIDLLYPTLSVMSTVSLAMLLFISEVLSVTDRWNKNLSDRFSRLILPLFIIFIYIVMSEVRTY